MGVPVSCYRPRLAISMSQHKTPFLRLGIRQKMILVLLSTLMLALGVNGWWTIERQQEDVLKETHRHAAEITRYVSRSLAFSVMGYDYPAIQFLLNELIKSPEIEYVKVSNVKGEAMAEAGQAHDTNQYQTLLHEPIRIDNEIIGHLTLGITTLNVVKNIEDQRSTLIKRESLIILLIALGEFFALSYFIVRPLSVISRYISGSITNSGKIVSDIPFYSADEFGDLARQFNRLRMELNDANERLQLKIDLADSKLLATNQKLLQQSLELQQLSITDSLTGLYNRRHFDITAESEIALSLRHGENNSLLLIDIDFFKKINDVYGHDVGDMVLRDVAKVLRQHTRKSDVVCRIGGEEFAILCKRVDTLGAMAVAEKLRAAIEAQRVRAGNQVLSLTISIGAASIPEASDIDSVEKLLKATDVALYQSKKLGRNRSTHFSVVARYGYGTEKDNVIPFKK